MRRPSTSRVNIRLLALCINLSITVKYRSFLDAWNEKSKKARHYITTMLRLQMEKEIVKYTGSLIATDLEVNIPATTGHTEDEDTAILALAKEALGDLDLEQLAALSFPGNPKDDIEEDHTQECVEDQV